MLEASDERSFPLIDNPWLLTGVESASLSADGEHLLHYHCDRLHELGATHWSCLRESSRRCPGAFPSLERREGLFPHRGGSTRPKSATISRPRGVGPSSVRQGCDG